MMITLCSQSACLSFLFLGIILRSGTRSFCAAVAIVSCSAARRFRIAEYYKCRGTLTGDFLVSSFPVNWPRPFLLTSINIRSRSHMSFNTPTSVLQINHSYAPSTYSPRRQPTFTSVPHPHPPHPPPTQHSISTNHQLNDHFVSMKGALLGKLRKRQVLNSPSGFPFQLSLGGTYSDHGVAQPRLLDSSYEFPEHVAGDPACCASFSYTAPAYRGECGTRCGNMSWQIKIPAGDRPRK